MATLVWLLPCVRVSVVRTASRYQFCRTQGLGWLLVQLVDAR